MPEEKVQSLLVQYEQLFAMCKYLGIYPHSLEAFRREHSLRKSKMGTLIVTCVLLLIVAFYNWLIYSFSEEDRSLKASQSTLTFVIGLFLTYIGLVMMATDQVNAIFNQARTNEIFERIRLVDTRLLQENVTVNNASLKMRIRIMMLIAVVSETVIMLSTYFTLVDYSKWTSLLWIFSCIPTLYNSLDKIWFAATLFALKQRFLAINVSLEDLLQSHEKYKRCSSRFTMTKEKRISTIDEENRFVNNYDYLCKEFNGADEGYRRNSSKNRISPGSVPVIQSFGATTPQKAVNVYKNAYNNIQDSELNNIPRIEEKLNNFCQLHDEICEIGKTLNELWGYPILILMAYGFLIFTAQLYFLYCASQNQAIPSLFRSAKNAIITAIYLIYTAGKCVYLIYLSWTTSLESKRTGVCLHKCGVVVDNNALYEIINHLSLKLLNHSVDFSACGFFTLDMETLYGVSGGITSYLIILIQFNLAAQQAKDAILTFTAFNDTSNMVAMSENRDIPMTMMSTAQFASGTTESPLFGI